MMTVVGSAAWKPVDACGNRNWPDQSDRGAGIGQSGGTGDAESGQAGGTVDRVRRRVAWPPAEAPRCMVRFRGRAKNVAYKTDSSWPITPIASSPKCAVSHDETTRL